MACMPRMALCGGLRIGVLIRLPKTPPLVMVNVPPCMSSSVSLPSRARTARSLMPLSTCATLRLWQPRSTGTTSPLGVLTATAMSTVLCFSIIGPCCGSSTMLALTSGKDCSAAAVALTKKPMKPRPMPCFFSNSSLYCLRRSITAPMSHSLKVVSMAAVCCACTRRCAMRWRSGVIFSRVLGEGRLGAVLRASGRARGVLLWRNAKTSSSRMRPPAPVPRTCDRSMPFSSASLRARGVARTSAACPLPDCATATGARLG